MNNLFFYCRIYLILLIFNLTNIIYANNIGDIYEQIHSNLITIKNDHANFLQEYLQTYKQINSIYPKVINTNNELIGGMLNSRVTLARQYTQIGMLNATNFHLAHNENNNIKDIILSLVDNIKQENIDNINIDAIFYSDNFYLKNTDIRLNEIQQHYNQCFDKILKFSQFINYLMSPTLISSSLTFDEIHKTFNIKKQLDILEYSSISNTWAILGSKSISYQIIMSILSKKISLLKNEQLSSANNAKQILANRRMHSKEWHEEVNQAPDIILEREKLFIYAEIAKGLYNDHQENQAVFIGLSALIGANASMINTLKVFLGNTQAEDVAVEQVDTPKTDPLKLQIKEKPSKQTQIIKENTETSFCFISTVIFGENAVETNSLRKFKHTYLSNNILGRGIITAYYIYSPDIINYLSKSEKLTKITKNNLLKFIDNIQKYESQ